MADKLKLDERRYISGIIMRYACGRCEGTLKGDEITARKCKYCKRRLKNNVYRSSYRLYKTGPWWKFWEKAKKEYTF